MTMTVTDSHPQGRLARLDSRTFLRYPSLQPASITWQEETKTSTLFPIESTKRSDHDAFNPSSHPIFVLCGGPPTEALPYPEWGEGRRHASTDSHE